ncbi:MAG: hypothetical protein RL240_2846, partial [Planctomycetota bacterium]
CFAPLAPGRGEGLGVRGKSAQWLLLRLGLGWRKLFVRLGLRGRHPHPPAPSPASGRGGAARFLRANWERFSPVRAREYYSVGGELYEDRVYARGLRLNFW